MVKIQMEKMREKFVRREKILKKILMGKIGELRKWIVGVKDGIAKEQYEYL